jgi:hypothetical protein
MVQSKKGETLIWGRAKVEFAALYQDIKILLEKEYPKTMLYESLRKEKKILMSYRRFCELVCKHFPEKAGKSKNMEKKQDGNRTHQNEIAIQKNTNAPKPIEERKAKPIGQRDTSKPYNTNI